MDLNYNGLLEFLDASKIKINEPMKNHTTLKVGGIADVLVLPGNVEEIVKSIEYAKLNNMPVTVIGNGSKLLVRDGGIRGLVIKLGSKFSNVEINDEKITAQSGITLPLIARVAKESSLSGLEFACGIPGTIGGAIYMNAGAYGSEMSNIVEEVTYLDSNLKVKTINKEELEFGYRQSYFKKNKLDGNIILSVVLKLQKGEIQEIEDKMKENSAQRKEKQPLEYPNAGSTFKRPEGYFVGKLIDEAGLKGKRIGGAQISTKHSGFIVNVDNATASDVIELIDLTKKEISSKNGVYLEEEIIIIGDEKQKCDK
ncbi:MAG: UDP-N-acetylmuramate dehydrogenase [Clostridia bacterium]|nr:UDP-N-acetylmuramate dehydrogenase [Clostridia bacterium]